MSNGKDIEFIDKSTEEKDSLSVVINTLRWVGVGLPLVIAIGCLIEDNAFVAFFHVVAAFLISPLFSKYLKWIGVRISTRLYVLIVIIWLVISGFFFFRMLDEEGYMEDEETTEQSYVISEE